MPTPDYTREATIESLGRLTKYQSITNLGVKYTRPPLPMVVALLTIYCNGPLAKGDAEEHLNNLKDHPFYDKYLVDNRVATVEESERLVNLILDDLESDVWFGDLNKGFTKDVDRDIRIFEILSGYAVSLNDIGVALRICDKLTRIRYMDCDKVLTIKSDTDLLTGMVHVAKTINRILTIPKGVYLSVETQNAIKTLKDLYGGMLNQLEQLDLKAYILGN